MKRKKHNEKGDNLREMIRGKHRVQYLLWLKKAKDLICNSLGMTVDEIENIILFDLWKATKGFQPDKKAKFSTYAGVCIDNRFKTLMVRSTSSKYNMLSYRAVCNSYEVDENTPEALMIATEEFKDCFNIKDERLIIDQEDRVRIFERKFRPLERSMRSRRKALQELFKLSRNCKISANA